MQDPAHTRRQHHEQWLNARESVLLLTAFAALGLSIVSVLTI
jgi:hypothetical protein